MNMGQGRKFRESKKLTLLQSYVIHSYLLAPPMAASRDFRLQTHHFTSGGNEHVACGSRAFKMVASFMQRLHEVRPPPCLLPTQSQTLTKESQELSVLSQIIARARSGLVQELVEVFHIVEVGGRPGAREECTVGGLVLPVPGDVRWRIIGYPPHINAVIAYTIHFLGLLTFYLGIKLPFEVSWYSVSDEGVNPGQTGSEAPEQAPTHG
ncbi:hypothetical protein BDR05DRAFT_953100 [Suillus weaverae]|nr:hypothetical protein BDR05DRAFT_953100 [Suillus weaverae]